MKPVRMLPSLCLMLLALLTLALGMAWAGHRLPTAQSLELHAYALAGLDTDLCGGDSHEAAMPHCPVCTQIGPAILPDPDTSFAQSERHAQAVTYLPQRRYALGRDRDPTTPLRGPPPRARAAPAPTLRG